MNSLHNISISSFIDNSPTCFHAVNTAEKILDLAGYVKLSEGCGWKLEEGKGYYVTRNLSSIIAFRMPQNKDFSGYMITASHTDSPCFKLKEDPELAEKYYVKLSCEQYGSFIYSSWLDRPLSVAGRAIVEENGTFRSVLFDLRDELTAIIPNVAIHMNRTVNSEGALNPAVDMVPVINGNEAGYNNIADLISKKYSCKKPVSADMFLYNPQKPLVWGDYFSSPRIDDLGCAYSSLTAFTKADKTNNIPVCCLFDNEEVGSMTKQGASSTFLFDVLERIGDSLKLTGSEKKSKLASSFMVSCDNGHAVHPNHPEYADKGHSVYMNNGVVIKYNAAQKYTSDAVSAGIFKYICNEVNVPTQTYANRADMPGGSTLGNLSNAKVSLNTVDIGLAQLAMHSSYETAGIKDVEYMITALKKFFEHSINTENDGDFLLK